MKLAAGMLNRRVVIQRRVVTQNADYGTSQTAWEDFTTVWAQVQDVLPSRSEQLADGIEIARRPARVRMRYRDDLDSTMRLVVGGRILNIIAGPAELGRRDGLEFVAEELTTEGDAP